MICLSLLNTTFRSSVAFSNLQVRKTVSYFAPFSARVAVRLPKRSPMNRTEERHQW